MYCTFIARTMNVHADFEYVMHRKSCQSLEDISFRSWLLAIDAGISNLSDAPPKFLLKALKDRTKLKNSTAVVKIAREASKNGSEELVVFDDILNPTLFMQLLECLNCNPVNLKIVYLKISFRNGFCDISEMVKSSLKLMINLEELSLINGATDIMLEGLETSATSLKKLNVFNSKLVTDNGILPLAENCSELESINIYDTKVTTRGCLSILRNCCSIKSLLSDWTAEAIMILNMKGSDPIQLENLTLSHELIHKSLLESLVNVSPWLKFIFIRRPDDETLDITKILNNFSMLEEFSAVSFFPFLDTPGLEIPKMMHLKILHLSSLITRTVSLVNIAQNCPQLASLTVENFDLVLHDSELNIDKSATFENLNILKIKTGYRNLSVLDPNFIIDSLKIMPKIQNLHLDNCRGFKDHHFHEILDTNGLNEIEEINLSNASKLSHNLIKLLATRCSNLNRIILTNLPSEVSRKLETLKTFLKENNARLTVVTFRNRSLEDNVGVDAKRAMFSTYNVQR